MHTASNMLLRRMGQLGYGRHPKSSLSSRSLFDTDIDMTPTSPGSNSYNCTISKNWSVGGAPNGGYLCGICLNAAKKISPFPHPLSLSTHFVSKATEGAPAIATVTALNIARSSATLQVTLSQGDRTRCVMIGTFGTIKKDGVSMLPARPLGPSLPPVQDCVCVSDVILSIFKNISLAKQFQFHTSKSTVLFNPDDISSKAELEGWIQFADERPHDLFSSLFFLDCLPPPVSNVVRAPWFPTLEYTVHFWADPAEYASGDNAPLRCRFSSDHIENDTFHTDAELYSTDGTKLLAKSRQLARVFR